MINRKLIVCYTTVLCLCMSSLGSFAQDKAKHTLPKLTPADFTLPNTPIIDSNSNAVILANVGEVRFVGNKNDWFSYVYTQQTRIKILNKQAFDLATIAVDLYGPKDGDIEKLSNVQASAYTLQNGQLQETKLDLKDIFQTRINSYYTEAKFSIPGVREGAIIEYTYTKTSAYDFDLPAWEFQWEKYPCLSSEYHVDIPQTLSYVVLRQGVHPYSLDKGSTGSTSYRVTQKDDDRGLGTPGQELIVTATTIKHDWGMKNIPAFRTEPFLTTPKNYIDKLSFQLSSIYNGQESFAKANSWAKATEELLGDPQFGGALKEDDEAIGELADKIDAAGDPLAQAKTVYYYVSQHYTCTNHYDKYVRTNLRDVIRNNSGTVGEINLLLTGLLRKKGIQADPVLLSSRDYGYNLVKYPMLDKLNYVIVRTQIDGKVYYLDATRPQLGFGMLTGDCYNGHARIISNKDSGSVFFEADSLKESSLTMVIMGPTDKGMSGSWQSTAGKQQSYLIRRRVREHGMDQYFKDIQTSYGDDADISNGGIDSIGKLEEPVNVHYDFLIKSEPLGASVLYFYPIMGEGWRENPFTAAERKYPVEMNYVMDQTYVFSMDVPDGYVVDELPKSTKVALNGDQGSFEYLIQNQDGRIQLRCRLRLNKAWFPAEDYSTLREFFTYVVKKEDEQIVLKKK